LFVLVRVISWIVLGSRDKRIHEVTRINTNHELTRTTTTWRSTTVSALVIAKALTRPTPKGRGTKTYLKKIF